METKSSEREAMQALHDEFGCKCGVPGCYGHEIVNGQAVIENHPKLGRVIIHNVPAAS